MNYYTNNKYYKLFLKDYNSLNLVSSLELADVLLRDVTKINLTGYPNIKYIVCPCTNIDHIINPYDAKIISLKDQTEFLNTITSTAEHTFNLILSLLRPGRTLDWVFERPENPGVRLSGKKLGIIGYGRIGKQVKTIAKAFGLKVNTVDIKNKNYVKRLHSILIDSDIISIHASIKKGQTPILKANEFNLIKKGCYLINTTRPDAIEQHALVEYLPKFNGVGLDVIDYNSISRINLLMSSKVIITPHIGGYTKEDLKSTFNFCMDRFLMEIVK